MDAPHPVPEVRGQGHTLFDGLERELVGRVTVTECRDHTEAAELGDSVQTATTLRGEGHHPCVTSSSGHELIDRIEGRVDQ
jgi:hypothetical protein